MRSSAAWIIFRGSRPSSMGSVQRREGRLEVFGCKRAKTLEHRQLFELSPPMSTSVSIGQACCTHQLLVLSDQATQEPTVL